MPYTVYLDAGHGGYDNGATDGNRKEKNDALDLTLAVGEILQNNGVDVGYTRVEDVYDSPLRKAQIANEAGADLFVSFHRNAAEYRNQYNGVQTLIFDNSGIKKEMADAINEALAEVGFVNIGTETRRDLAVLRRTQMPALLVEAGFIDSDIDNAIFDENFDEMAQAIAYAILGTLQSNGLVRANIMRRTDVAGTAGSGNGDAGNPTSAVEMANEGEVPPENGMTQSMQQNQGMGNLQNAAQQGQNMRTTPNATGGGNMRTAPNMTGGDTVRTTTNIGSGYQVGGRCICPCNQEEVTEPSYMIQTGLYRNYANALRERRRLEQDGYPAMIQLYRRYFAVITGYYDNMEEAQAAETALRSLGYDTLIRTVK